ncbi:MAG: hypothetical protein WAX29_00510 [Propionibacterium sp.]
MSRRRQGTTRRGGALGFAAVLLGAVVLFVGLVGPGLLARAQAGVPLDDSAASKGFLRWAFAQVSERAGTSELSALQLGSDELDLTMRRGDTEQRWQVFPQNLPRLVESHQVTATDGVVSASSDQALDLALIWSDYRADVSNCAASDTAVSGAASWGGAMHFTASCQQGEAQTQEWLGSWPVELQGTLSTRYSLGVMISDLGKLSPPTVGSLELTMGGVDAAGCRATTSWRQEVAGRSTWIDQTRLCYTDGSSSFLPIDTVQAPGDAETLLAHPLELAQVDTSVLEGLSSSSELPSTQPDIDRLRIAWSDRFGQQVIRATSGSGSAARTGWYSLSGVQLALDQG